MPKRFSPNTGRHPYSKYVGGHPDCNCLYVQVYFPNIEDKLALIEACNKVPTNMTDFIRQAIKEKIERDNK